MKITSRMSYVSEDKHGAYDIELDLDIESLLVECGLDRPRFVEGKDRSETLGGIPMTEWQRKRLKEKGWSDEAIKELFREAEVKHQEDLAQRCAPGQIIMPIPKEDTQQ